MKASDVLQLIAIIRFVDQNSLANPNVVKKFEVVEIHFIIVTFEYESLKGNILCGSLDVSNPFNFSEEWPPRGPYPGIDIFKGDDLSLVSSPAENEKMQMWMIPFKTNNFNVGYLEVFSYLQLTGPV